MLSQDHEVCDVRSTEKNEILCLSKLCAFAVNVEPQSNHFDHTKST
jgi:hypothetical protein